MENSIIVPSTPNLKYQLGQSERARKIHTPLIKYTNTKASDTFAGKTFRNQQHSEQIIAIAIDDNEITFTFLRP